MDLLTEGGQSAEHYQYTAFGAPAQGSLLGNPYFFAGALYESSFGMSFMRSRWYAPDMGRFVSPDSLGIFGGLNLYTYAANQPTRFTDPYGQFIVGYIPQLGGFIHWISDTLGTILKLRDEAQEFYSLVFNAPEAFQKALEGRFYEIALTEIVGTVGGMYAASALCGPAMPVCAFGTALIASEMFGQVGAELGKWMDNKLLGSGTGGGQCPTFIQARGIAAKRMEGSNLRTSQLIGRLDVPSTGTLLRSDIPVFGVAHGKDFKKYRVEYGVGPTPRLWTVIHESFVPQTNGPNREHG